MPALSRTLLLLGAAGAAFGLAPLAMAQHGKLADEMTQSGPAHDSADDAPDPHAAERARLNQEQANAARAQLEENAASQQAHDNAVRERETLIRQQEASTASAQANYDAAMARWHQTVDACKRRDRKRCEEGQQAP